MSVAYSGRAALDALEDFQPDSILLDIGMPDMHGYEVARRIRASGGFSGVLLIALTGWGQEHDQRQSKAAGFDHHVVKPPDINRLRELLTSEQSSAAPSTSSSKSLFFRGFREGRYVRHDGAVLLGRGPDVAAALAAVVVHRRKFTRTIQFSRRRFLTRRAGLIRHGNLKSGHLSGFPCR